LRGLTGQEADIRAGPNAAARVLSINKDCENGRALGEKQREGKGNRALARALPGAANCRKRAVGRSWK